MVLKSGVPQGSILGPLLFLTYINDLCNIPLSPGTKLMLFADDIMLFKPISVSHDAALFQTDVNPVNDWVFNNHLTINTNKTKFMLISRRRKIPKNFPPLYLNNVQIESVSHFSLGRCGLSAVSGHKLAFTSRHYALFTATDMTALYY